MRMGGREAEGTEYSVQWGQKRDGLGHALKAVGLAMLATGIILGGFAFFFKSGARAEKVPKNTAEQTAE